MRDDCISLTLCDVRWAALILAQRESSKGLLEIILLVATIFKKLNSCDWQVQTVNSLKYQLHESKIYTVFIYVSVL